MRAVLLLAAVACARETALNLPPGAEALSLLGDTLWPVQLSDSVRAGYEARLTDARMAYMADSSDPETIIWYGRRTAYLSRYRDATEIYTRGIARHPNDPRMLRHRGHRYISTRQLEVAVADLTRAAGLIADRPDEIEPDGLPNARNLPRSTLHTNIWYHLGLAHYLRGDFTEALAAYQRCLAAATNDDMLVATGHWLYMTLRRLSKDREAADLLARFRPEMDVIENAGYHRLLLMYRGELPPDSLLDLSADDLSVAGATTAYGVGTWHLYNGREAEAFNIFEAIVNQTDQWAAFGYIAAEAELARRRGDGG